MRSGPLRHRITFQRRADTLDAFGHPSTGWQDVATVWASVEPISGRERLSANQVQAETTHRIRTRGRPGLAPSMRIRFGVRVFDIQSIIDRREIGAELEILAVEGLTDG